MNEILFGVLPLFIVEKMRVVTGKQLKLWGYFMGYITKNMGLSGNGLCILLLFCNLKGKIIKISGLIFVHLQTDSKVV